MFIQHSGKTDTDLALLWAERIDGIHIFPKLPVHMRLKRESFDKRTRIIDAIKKLAVTSADLTAMFHSGDLRCPINLKTDHEMKQPPQNIGEVITEENSTKTMLIHVGGIRMDGETKRDERVTDSATGKKITRGPDKVARAKRKCSVCKEISCKGSGKKNLCPFFVSST